MARLPEIWRVNQPSLFDQLFSFDDLFSDRSMPQMDVDETEDAYLVSMDMPGVPKENINIDLNGNILTVTGERKSRSEGKSSEQGQQRSYTKFQRSFTLPNTVDVNKVEASCENGLLEIYLPKSEESRPKRIEIGTGTGSFRDRMIGSRQSESADQSVQNAKH